MQRKVTSYFALSVGNCEDSQLSSASTSRLATSETGPDTPDQSEEQLWPEPPKRQRTEVVPSSKETSVDCGFIADGSVPLVTLEGTEKLHYISNHFVPPLNYSAFVKQTVTKGTAKREKTLTFQHSWLEKYRWLVYSPHLRGGLCKYCVLFSPRDPRVAKAGVLVSKPLNNLSKAGGKDGFLECHQRLRYHSDAMAQAMTLRSSLDRPDATIPVMISNKNKELYEKNLCILEVLVKAVLLCGRQNIPLRGHRDDETNASTNRGNFIAIVNLIAEHDSRLRTHLDTAARNAKGTSKTTQNDLIDVIKTHIQASIAEKIAGESRVFSIIADEVTDRHSNQEILCVCLRYLVFENQRVHIKESVIDFVHMERTTGASLASAIIRSLAACNVDITKARGQSYDGAAAMSSSRVGVQARIKEASPKALYTHCSNHRLNLSIATACKIPQVRLTVDVINEAFFFFDMSPKRQRFLERVLEAYGSEQAKRRLCGLCRTRWVERHTALDTFYNLYHYVCLCLEAMTVPDQHRHVYARTDIEASTDDSRDLPPAEQWSWDRDTKMRAAGLLVNLKSSDTIVSFMIVKNALEVVKPLATKLQKRDRDVIDAYGMIDSTISRLRALRCEVEQEFKSWFNDSVKLADLVGTEIQTPRVVARQAHRSNNPSSSPEEHYRTNTAVPFIDHMLQEMDTRFAQEERVGKAIFCLLPSYILSDGPDTLERSLHEELLFWEEDLPSPSSLRHELQEWCRFWRTQTLHSVPEDLRDTLCSTDGDVFPNIRQLLIIGCTLPISSAEAERSFSALRRVKSYTRSTMTEERFTGLALMHVHQDIPIDTKAICLAFIRKHQRRMFSACVMYD